MGEALALFRGINRQGLHDAHLEHMVSLVLPFFLVNLTLIQGRVNAVSRTDNAP